jgi:hypothetical protein
MNLKMGAAWTPLEAAKDPPQKKCMEQFFIKIIIIIIMVMRFHLLTSARYSVPSEYKGLLHNALR